MTTFMGGGGGFWVVLRRAQKTKQNSKEREQQRLVWWPVNHAKSQQIFSVNTEGNLSVLKTLGHDDVSLERAGSRRMSRPPFRLKEDILENSPILPQTRQSCLMTAAAIKRRAECGWENSSKAQITAGRLSGLPAITIMTTWRDMIVTVLKENNLPRLGRRLAGGMLLKWRLVCHVWQCVCILPERWP